MATASLVLRMINWEISQVSWQKKTAHKILSYKNVFNVAEHDRSTLVALLESS